MERNRKDRNGGVLDTVAELFDLPADLVAGLPHLEMMGSRQLYLEHHTGILAYSDEQIDVNTTGGVLRVRGARLALMAMTAEELHALAEPILPMNASTVYRTLNTLTEKKILIRSVRQDGKAYYSLAKKDHSHRLVCDLCGKVIPVDTCPLSELEETLQQKTGFRITGHSLEFTGLCPECSKKDTDEK